MGFFFVLFFDYYFYSYNLFWKKDLYVFDNIIFHNYKLFMEVELRAGLIIFSHNEIDTLNLDPPTIYGFVSLTNSLLDLILSLFAFVNTFSFRYYTTKRNLYHYFQCIY